MKQAGEIWVVARDIPMATSKGRATRCMDYGVFVESSPAWRGSSFQ